MIRIATENDFIREITCESELRICSLMRAYGLNVPFIQFFADDNGAIASIMDGVCTLFCPELPNDEWCAFLQMHPDVFLIHTSGETGAFLAETLHCRHESGKVMCLENVLSKTALQTDGTAEASVREIYAVLSAVFSDFSSFDGWYVDASHRVRHGCCHYAVERLDGNVSSVAMTVAEAENCALIGCVATLPNFRGRGAATRCITCLIDSLAASKIYIAPSDEYSASLYKKIGFVTCGTWAELNRQ